MNAKHIHGKRHTDTSALCVHQCENPQSVHSECIFENIIVIFFFLTLMTTVIVSESHEQLFWNLHETKQIQLIFKIFILVTLYRCT